MYRGGWALLIDAHTCTIPTTRQFMLTPGGAGGKAVGVSVTVAVGVLHGVTVAVRVGVIVGVTVAVGVGVSVGVTVAVSMDVTVGVSVGVGHGGPADNPVTNGKYTGPPINPIHKAARATIHLIGITSSQPHPLAGQQPICCRVRQRQPSPPGVQTTVSHSGVIRFTISAMI